MNIVFYPKDINPYQTLLFNHIKKNSDAKIIYGYPYIPLNIIKYRLRGFSIFHLHWLYPFQFVFLRKYEFISRIFSSFYLIIFFLFLKALRYKVVYTVHDIVSHDQQFLNEIWATKFVCKLSDQIIVHTKSTFNQLVNMKVEENKINIIPHGNYIGYYPNNVSKSTARNRLSLDEKDFVVLFFGMIKEYKGLDLILRSVDAIKNRKVKLIIAGECKDKIQLDLISFYKYKLRERVLLYIQHIRDSDVQYFFNASDFVVSAFKKSTTSGSMIMALSFRKPIICPALETFKDFPQNVGFFYKPVDTKNFVIALKSAIKAKSNLEKYENDAYNYAKTLSWDKISEATIKIYGQL